MTEEEFFAKIERAEEQPGKSFANVDVLSAYGHYDDKKNHGDRFFDLFPKDEK